MSVGMIEKAELVFLAFPQHNQYAINRFGYCFRSIVWYCYHSSQLQRIRHQLKDHKDIISHYFLFISRAQNENTTSVYPFYISTYCWEMVRLSWLKKKYHIASYFTEPFAAASERVGER